MKQKGQVILIVLIISALLMTIGLSISRKAVVETTISTDEELLKQAFNTAESGIDYYLGTGKTDYVAPGNTKIADVSVSEIGVGNTGIDFNEFFLENNPALFWLVAHDINGDINYSSYYTANSLNICVGNAFTGSLKVDLYYKNGTVFGVDRNGYNFSTGPNVVSGFIDMSSATQGACPSGKKAVNFTRTAGTVPLLISVTPIWSGTNISLIGTAAFPSQGSEISSVGRAGDLSSGVNRKVTVQNRYTVPTFLLEAITAGDSVTNN